MPLLSSATSILLLRLVIHSYVFGRFPFLKSYHKMGVGLDELAKGLVLWSLAIANTMEEGEGKFPLLLFCKDLPCPQP